MVEDALEMLNERDVVDLDEERKATMSNLLVADLGEPDDTGGQRRLDLLTHPTDGSTRKSYPLRIDPQVPRPWSDGLRMSCAASTPRSSSCSRRGRAPAGLPAGDSTADSADAAAANDDLG